VESRNSRLISSSALAIAAGDGTTAVLESDGSILQLGSGPAAPQQSTALLSGNALFVVGNTNLGTGGSTMRQTSIARTACSSVASVALAGAASAYADQPVIFTNAGDVAVLGDTMNSEQGI